jgi:hypothetical protein
MARTFAFETVSRLNEAEAKHGASGSSRTKREGAPKLISILLI